LIEGLALFTVAENSGIAIRARERFKKCINYNYVPFFMPIFWMIKDVLRGNGGNLV